MILFTWQLAKCPQMINCTCLFSPHINTNLFWKKTLSFNLDNQPTVLIFRWDREEVCQDDIHVYMLRKTHTVPRSAVFQSKSWLIFIRQNNRPKINLIFVNRVSRCAFGAWFGQLRIFPRPRAPLPNCLLLRLFIITFVYINSSLDVNKSIINK